VLIVLRHALETKNVSNAGLRVLNVLMYVVPDMSAMILRNVYFNPYAVRKIRKLVPVAGTGYNLLKNAVRALSATKLQRADV